MSLIHNQKGSMSLVMTIGLVSVSAIVLFNMSSVFGTMNQQRKHQRLNLNSQKQLFEVSLMIKKSVTMGDLDPTCASLFDGSEFKPVNVSGKTLCMPRNGGLCSTDTETGDALCVSTDVAALQVPVDKNLKRASASTMPESQSLRPYQGQSESDQEPEGERTYASVGGNSSSSGNRNTRITVPNATDPLWRNCDGASDLCLRLVVCPIGTTDCNLEDGDKFQVVNLSSL